jgi:hypothetical protein
MREVCCGRYLEAEVQVGGVCKGGTFCAEGKGQVFIDCIEMRNEREYVYV